MATVITSECINCGACEPECPNTAIYQGGVEWQAPDGAMHPAISNDIFYIVPEKCTECVGFHDHEACAAVCPVDCCVPDPNIPETHDVLLARARALHPPRPFPTMRPPASRRRAAAPLSPPRSRSRSRRLLDSRRRSPLPRRQRRPRPPRPPRHSGSPFRRPRSGRSRSAASVAAGTTPSPSSTSAPAPSSTARTVRGLSCRRSGWCAAWRTPWLASTSDGRAPSRNSTSAVGGS